MMKTSKSIITVLLLTLILPLSSSTLLAQTRPAKNPVDSAANDDIKLRIRTTMESQSFESTQYVKGGRERNEMSIGKGFVNLMQCDLKRTIQINDAAKTYMIQPFGDGGATTNAQADGNTTKPSSTTPQQKRGGVVTHTTTITDTGERQEMFGFIARRIKTSMVSESSPDACNQEKMRMESDGWYIDFNFGASCQQQTTTAASNPYHRNPCQDEVRVKNTGSGKLGFPLNVTTTMYGADGRQTLIKREVLELSRARFDAALFDVPAGYSEAKNYQQLMGLQANSMSSGDGRDYAPPANSKARNDRSSASLAIPIKQGNKGLRFRD